jgi:hypothetical protein
MSMNKGELISEIKRYKELFGIISEQKDEILRMLGVLRDASATKAEKQEVEALLRNQNFTDAEIKAIKKGEQQVINQTLATLERKFPQISGEISDILVSRGISKKALASIEDGIDFIRQVEYLNYQKNVTKKISPAVYADEIALLLGRFDTIANIGHLRRVVTTVEEESAASISKKIEKETGEKTGGKLNNFFSSGNKKGASNGFWGVVSKFLGLPVVGLGIGYFFIKSEAKKEIPNIIKAVKDFASEGGITPLVGEPLFRELLTKTISGDAKGYAKSVGLSPENITNIDKDVNDIISEENWFSSLSEEELGEFLNKMTTSYDGVNFLYFLKKFNEVKGKNFYSWLVSDINGVEGADFSAEEIETAFKKVNPSFQFIKDVSYPTYVRNINQILTIYQNVSNPDTGIENIYYKDYGSDKKLPWKKFETTSGSTLSITNINNQITTFSSDEINKIKTSASNYLDEYWRSMAESGTIDNIVKKVEEVTGNESKEISNTLDENKMYDYVYDKLESEYPKFADISIDWKTSIQKNGGITESVKGLNKILFEKRGDGSGSSSGGNSGRSSGGSTATKPKFTGPGTVQQFQDWLDTNYPTWLNGGKLNKGKGYGSYGPSTQKAFTQYGSAYQNSSSNSDGGVAQQSETVDKAKEIFDKFNDSIWFFSTNNERMNIEYRPEMAKTIKYLRGRNYIEECSYLGAILSLYGKNISKYKTDIDTQNKIDTQLPSLQKYLQTILEGIQLKRPNGLSQILEQVSDFVVVNVVSGIPKKQTEDDNYKDMSSVTIKSIIGGGTELRKGDRSDTIVRVKEALGYTKDTTPYFTQDFDTFVIKYKGTNKLDNTNGNISKDLMCSIEQYKQLCSTSSGQKTTAPPTNTTDSTPIELKYLNDYANAVGNGVPSYGTCKSLFDYYSQQALNYRRLKKVNQEPKITVDQLKPIKDKILYCQKSSDLKDRAKLDTLISQRFRIQQDKDSPYYLDI